MRIRYAIAMVGIVLLAGGLVIDSSSAQVQAQGGESCSQLAVRAFSELGTNCANLTRGSLCYGFDGVTATFTPIIQFDEPGDQVDLAGLESVQTAGMNTATGDWGIAAFSIQANLPAGLDESVSLLLIGDGAIENAVDPALALPVVEPLTVVTKTEANLRSAPGLNAHIAEAVPAGASLLADGLSPDGGWVRVASSSGAAWVELLALEEAELDELPAISRDSLTPFQSFVFKTGAAGTGCLEAPPPVLVVQGPEEIPVEIIANGTPIRIESTIFLRTLPNNVLELVVGMGRAVLNPGTPDAQIVPPGSRISASLDEDGQVSGGWSGWRLLQQSELDGLLPLENIPPNVWNYPYVNPQVIIASGVGGPSPIVQTPHGPVTPLPPSLRTFPRLDMTPRPGQDLQGPEWAGISVGAAICADWVLFQSDADGDWDVYRRETNGTITNISRGPGSSDIQASFSIDGEWVAFTSNRDGFDNWEIWISNITGAPQTRLTYNSAPDINPVWGPDGRLIFETSRDGNWELYLIDLAGDGEPVRLTDDPGNDINAFWAPDGKSIFFQSDRDGDWELFQLTLEDSSLERLTTNDLEDQMPVVSHDGKQLAWLQQNPYGVYQLMLMTLETRETRQMTDTGTDIGGQLFDPDDTFLVYHTQTGDSYEVFAVEIESGTIKNISNSPASEDSASAFVCGSPVVIFQSDRNPSPDRPGQHELFQVNPLPIDGPASAPVLLYSDPIADDLFPNGADRDERNTRAGQTPPHDRGAAS